MNWFKSFKISKNIHASPALFELNKLKPPHAGEISRNVKKFFNYIKSRNITIPVYHGTNSRAWGSAQKQGYLLSPVAGKFPDTENRLNPGDEEFNDIATPQNAAGTKQVFFSMDKNYARDYAMRFQDGILLKINLPLYAVAEVQAALTGQNKKIYNEQWKQNRISKIIANDEMEDNIKVNRIIHVLAESQFCELNEVTSYMGLPLKWVARAEKVQIINNLEPKPEPPLGKPPSFIKTPEQSSISTVTAQSQPTSATNPVFENSINSKCTTAAVVIRANNKVLLLQRGTTAPWMPGYWNLPGGILENNETPEQAAKRECLEESGIVPATLTPVYQTTVEGCPVHFFGTTIQSEKQINLDYESSNFAWITLQQLNSYPTVPGVADAIKRYLNGI